jgi:hypothetical protein
MVISHESRPVSRTVACILDSSAVAGPERTAAPLRGHRHGSRVRLKSLRVGELAAGRGLSQLAMPGWVNAVTYRARRKRCSATTVRSVEWTVKQLRPAPTVVQVSAPSA